jgi:hypothetical protein
MLRAPKGEKRPADVIGAAVMVTRIATGGVEEKRAPDSAAAALGRKGGAARAAKLSPEKRREIDQKGAKKPLEKIRLQFPVPLCQLTPIRS